MVRILEAYVPMKIQIRQEEVWASQFQRNKACIGTQRMHRLDAGHSDYKFMCKACGTGWGKPSSGMGEAWVPLAPVVPGRRQTATWTARSWGELLRKRTRQRRSPWLTWSRLTGGWISGRRSCPWRRTMRRCRSGSASRRQRLELPALPPPGGPGDSEEGRAAQGLDGAPEPTPEESSARQRHKELVTDEMLDNEMAIVAPLQEGMQALPAEEVANEGARPSERSTWSDSRPSCEISTCRVRVSTPARHWLMRWAPFRRRRRRTSAPRTQTRRGCLTTPSSPWSKAPRRMLTWPFMEPRSRGWSLKGVMATSRSSGV